MTTTGWLKTLNGADVYTDDGEWYWDHATQGWFYAPGLLTAVPAPPLGTRVSDEVDRLTHNWPKLRGMFPIRNGVRGSDFVVGILCRAYLVWFAVWTAVHATRIYGGWYDFVNEPRTQDYFANRAFYDQRSEAWGKSLLFIAIALACLYLLYMVYVNTVDPHKGALMFGAIVVGSAYYNWRRHQNARTQQIVQALRDGNRS